MLQARPTKPLSDQAPTPPILGPEEARPCFHKYLEELDIRSVCGVMASRARTERNGEKKWTHA